jgi:hypothetical protein
MRNTDARPAVRWWARRQPIYQRSVARWKHYESALGALFDRLEHRPAVAT